MKMRLHLLELDADTEASQELTPVYHEGKLCLDCTYAPERRECFWRSVADVESDERCWQKDDRSARAEDDGDEEYAYWPGCFGDFDDVPPADPSKPWTHPDDLRLDWWWSFYPHETPEQQAEDEACRREYDDLWDWVKYHNSRHKRCWYPIAGAWAQFQRWLSRRLRNGGGTVCNPNAGSKRQRLWNRLAGYCPGWPPFLPIPGLYERITNSFGDDYSRRGRMLGWGSGKRCLAKRDRLRNRRLCREFVAGYHSGECCDDSLGMHAHDYCNDSHFGLFLSDNYDSVQQPVVTDLPTSQTSAGAAGAMTTVNWHNGRRCTADHPCGDCHGSKRRRRRRRR